MSLSEQLSEYIRACFTGLWIQSHEHQDALLELAQLCRQEEWRLATWNIDAGLSIAGQAAEETGGSDPLAAIRSLSAIATPDGAAILVLENFHRFLQSAEIVQALGQQILAGKQSRTFIMVLAPVVQIPAELEKLFAVLEHEMPSREQLEEIARGVATEEGELPADSDLETVLDAASGLTRYEAENAFSLSLVRHGKVRADAVWELKTQTLKKSGLLTLHRGAEDFSSLGGLSALKAFTRRALLQAGRNHPLKRPRGVLLLSPPGCGKSQFCKTLGREVGRPVLILDVGSLMGTPPSLPVRERGLKHNPNPALCRGWGALLLTLPIVSVLAFILTWTEHRELGVISRLARETLELVPPGLRLFLPLAHRLGIELLDFSHSLSGWGGKEPANHQLRLRPLAFASSSISRSFDTIFGRSR